MIGLLVGLRLLSLRGVPQEELTAATRLTHLCGLLTLALNVAEPVVTGRYGRAAVDAVAPLLLLGWGPVGPQFLRHFHALSGPNPAEAPVPVPAVEHLPDPLASLDPTPEPVLVPPSGSAPARLRSSPLSPCLLPCWPRGSRPPRSRPSPRPC